MYRSVQANSVLVALLAACFCGCNNQHQNSAAKERVPSQASHAQKNPASSRPAATPSGSVTTAKSVKNHPFSPLHEYLYLADGDDSSIRQFCINADGSLSVLAPPHTVSGADWETITALGSKRVVYAASENGLSETISPFLIRKNGTLNRMKPFALTSTKTITKLTPDVNGEFLGIQFDHLLEDQTTSWYRVLGGARLQHVERSQQKKIVALTPGSVVYQAGPDDTSIAAYRVQPDGILRPQMAQKIADAPVGTHPVITTVANHYLYVGFWDNTADPVMGENGWPIRVYRIHRGGRLTYLDTFSKVSIALPTMHTDPLGKFLYVANGHTGSVYIFRVRPDGHLQAVGDLLKNLYPVDFVVVYLN